MPAVSFIPGPGDSAQANSPLAQVGALQQILLENQQAKDRHALAQSALQESDARVQMTQMQAQALGLENSFLPQMLQGKLEEQQARVGLTEENTRHLAQSTLAQTLANEETDLGMATALKGKEVLVQERQFKLDEDRKLSQQHDEAIKMLKEQGPELAHALGYEGPAANFMSNGIVMDLGLKLKKMQIESQQVQNQAKYYEQIAGSKEAQAKLQHEMVVQRAASNIISNRIDPASAPMMADALGSIDPVLGDMVRAKALTPDKPLTYDQMFATVMLDPEASSEGRLRAMTMLAQNHNMKPPMLPAAWEGEGEAGHMVPERVDEAALRKQLEPVLKDVIKTLPQKPKQTASTNPSTQPNLKPLTRSIANDYVKRFGANGVQKAREDGYDTTRYAD